MTTQHIPSLKVLPHDIYSFNCDKGNGWGHIRVFVFQDHVIKVASDIAGSGNAELQYYQVPGFNGVLDEAEPGDHIDNTLFPYQESDWAKDDFYLAQ